MMIPDVLGNDKIMLLVTNDKESITDQRPVGDWLSVREFSYDDRPATKSLNSRSPPSNSFLKDKLLAFRSLSYAHTPSSIKLKPRDDDDSDGKSASDDKNDLEDDEIDDDEDGKKSVSEKEEDSKSVGALKIGNNQDFNDDDMPKSSNIRTENENDDFKEVKEDQEDDLKENKKNQEDDLEEEDNQEDELHDDKKNQEDNLDEDKKNDKKLKEKEAKEKEAKEKEPKDKEPKEKEPKEKEPKEKESKERESKEKESKDIPSQDEMEDLEDSRPGNLGDKSNFETSLDGDDSKSTGAIKKISKESAVDKDINFSPGFFPKSEQMNTPPSVPNTVAPDKKSQDEKTEDFDSKKQDTSNANPDIALKSPPQSPSSPQGNTPTSMSQDTEDSQNENIPSSSESPSEPNSSKTESSNSSPLNPNIENNRKSEVGSNQLPTNFEASPNTNPPSITAKSSSSGPNPTIITIAASAGGSLVLLVIIIYIIRCWFRKRRIGKAESPPPSPLIDRDPNLALSASSSINTDSQSISDKRDQFSPFHEEQRLREKDMKETYGIVV